MKRWIWILIALLPHTGIAGEYKFRTGQTLGQTDTAADFVFKGTVISSATGAPIHPPSYLMFFGSEDTFADTVTTFKIVSVIKGDKSADEITFRHHEDITPEGKRSGLLQVAYHFEPGRTYLVFASKTETAGLYAQMGYGFGFKTDYGMMRCANDQPVTAKAIQEIVWDELAVMLHDKNAADVAYAMLQLDQLSGGIDHPFPADYRYGIDFQRQNVAGLVRGLIRDPDIAVARNAIAFIGTHNPYMDENRTLDWLAKVSPIRVQGLGLMKETVNLGGAYYWEDLASVADGKADGVTRALAVLALGRVREPAVESHLEKWLVDPEAAVRSSAAILLADYPGMATRERINKMAADTDSNVAAAVARSIGFGQRTEYADVLSKLLKHPDPKVRKYAAMSLLSFAPDAPGVTDAMQANLDDPLYGGLITNALAHDHPEKYFDRLVQVAEGKMKGPWDVRWGGNDSAGDAWWTLFGYVKSQSDEDIQAGKFDTWLDALDHVVILSTHHANQHELLEFYNQQGLAKRVRKFAVDKPL